jgi:SAM-dependent methyltransferase
MSGFGDWVYEFFVRKGGLYLRELNRMWESAPREALSVKRILESLGVSEGSLILDLGCGNGRISVNLARLGFRVVGVDISPIFIEDAVEKARLHGVEDRVVFRIGDARRVDEELGGMLFDVILIYWTTILGFYGDESVDVDILRRARRITRDGGYLLVLNSASYDSVALRAGLVEAKASYYTDVDEELARVSVSEFDPVRSVLTVTRRYYRKSEGNLLFLDEVTFKIRVYTLHELVGMAEGSGWQYVKAYKDVETLEPYTPALSGLNVVFKAV